MFLAYVRGIHTHTHTHTHAHTQPMYTHTHSHLTVLSCINIYLSTWASLPFLKVKISLIYFFFQHHQERHSLLTEDELSPLLRSSSNMQKKKKKFFVAVCSTCYEKYVNLITSFDELLRWFKITVERGGLHRSLQRRADGSSDHFYMTKTTPTISTKQFFTQVNLLH